MDLIESMRKENWEYTIKVIEAAESIKKKIGKVKPKLAIILGSGLGPLTDELFTDQPIPYSEIPHFPIGMVKGHAGELILAEHEGNDIVLMSGRSHFYEYAGSPELTQTQAMRHITLPIRALKGIGIDSLLVSNAAGGLNSNWEAPQLMICDSVQNRSGANPLYGMNLDLLGDRFPPMGGDECNSRLLDLMENAASLTGADLEHGVYAMMPGPNYEFTGECQEMQKAGIVTAVGMSTVPEILAALHGYYSSDDYISEGFPNHIANNGIPVDEVNFDYARRLEVLAVSCISNIIDENGKNATDHKEVIENGKKAVKEFVPMVKKFIELYHE